jgi:hypothetical protein
LAALIAVFEGLYFVPKPLQTVMSFEKLATFFACPFSVVGIVKVISEVVS